MPQLDISTYSSQIFWLCISFFLFLTFCSFVLSPRLKNNYNKRNDLILADQAEASDNDYKSSEILSSLNKKFETVKIELNESFKKEKMLLFKKYIEDRDLIKNENKALTKKSILSIKDGYNKIDGSFSNQLVDELINQLELKYKNE